MVERGGFEIRCACKGTQGSNPCLSAIYRLKIAIFEHFFADAAAAGLPCIAPRRITSVKTGHPRNNIAATRQISEFLSVYSASSDENLPG